MGIKHLAELLAFNTSLTDVRLSNQKQPAGIDAEQTFAKSLAKNETIVKLGLQFRDAASRNAVDRAIMRNKDTARKLRLAQNRERLQLVIYNLIHTNAGHKLTDGSMVFQKSVIYDALEKNWFYLTGHAGIAGERGSIMTTLSQQLTKRVEGLMSLPEHPLPMCAFDGNIKKGNVTRLAVFDVAEDGSVQNAHSTAVDGAAGFGTDLYYELATKKRKLPGSEGGSAVEHVAKVPKIKVKNSVLKGSVVQPPPAPPATASAADLLAYIETLHAHYGQQIAGLQESLEDSNKRKEDPFVDNFSTPAWKIIGDAVTADNVVLEAALMERDEALHLAEQARDLLAQSVKTLAALQGRV
ncbi:UNVERIFIED_CONTAM: Tropomodulin-1 [Siphonaria sp. JEL0065]|nr:Tropomodulin-1 [Siphonaria sp. JEL0065]